MQVSGGGPLQVRRLRKAVEGVLARHPILTACFKTGEAAGHAFMALTPLHTTLDAYLTVRTAYQYLAVRTPRSASQTFLGGG